MGHPRVLGVMRMSADPELKYTQGGTAIATLRLVTNEKYKDKETVCFVTGEAWGKLAEVINEYFSKGDTIFIDGKLKYDTWETDDGQKRSIHKITVLAFDFVGGGYKGREKESPKKSSDASDDDIPF